jgi:LysR family transcriptional regulator, nod-box dependent transcriptional activator
LRRNVALHLPYFQTAIKVLEATDLVLTMPARIAEQTLAALNLPKLKAPKEIPEIRYSMVWHPRFDSDLLQSGIRDTVRQIFRRPAR